MICERCGLDHPYPSVYGYGAEFGPCIRALGEAVRSLPGELATDLARLVENRPTPTQAEKNRRDLL